MFKWIYSIWIQNWLKLKKLILQSLSLLRKKTLPTPQSRNLNNNLSCGNKVFILGSGRAGTSFLTNLLDNLGIDGRIALLPWFANTRSGLEWNHEHILRGDYNLPYLLKNPNLTKHIDTLVKKYTIDCVIIPVRYSPDQIKSRQRNFNDQKTTTDDVELANGKLISKLVYYDIPFVIIAYPKMVKSQDYLFTKVNEILAIIKRNPIDREKFNSVFDKLVF